MFNKEDILAQLAAGKKIEEIAQEAADALNLAKAEYDRKRAEEELAKKQAEKARLQKQAEKEQRAGDLVHGLITYLADFHPKFMPAEDVMAFDKHFNAKELVEAIDATIAQIESIPAVAEQMKKCGGKAPFEFSVELKNEDAKKAEDAIGKFLRENDLF